MKKFGAIFAITLLILTLLSFTTIVRAAGPNYIYFADQSKDSDIDVIVGNTFRFDIWTQVNERVETINVKNVSYLPAGIVNYVAQTNTVRGSIFWAGYNDGYETFFKRPGTADIHDAQGWTGGSTNNWLWAVQSSSPDYSVNNTDEQTWNVTWTAASCGVATFTVQPYAGSWGGTAYKGTSVGTSYNTGTVTVHPMAITGLTATPVGSDTINLGWTKHTGDDYTLIRYRTDTYPTSITDGLQAYNNTGTSYAHGSLTGGLTYYYSAWGYNATADIWSLTYVTAYAQTNAAPVVSSPNPADGAPNIDKTQSSVSAYISDPEGNLINWTIETSLGNSNNGNGVGNGTRSCSLSPPLTYDAVVTWWVNATDTGSGTWTRETYTFTVRSQYIPGAPGSFTATPITRFRIDLSWTKGSDADQTWVVAKLGSDPTSRTDGTNIYYSTGTSYSNIGLSPNQHWYYRAYSWNDTDSSWGTAYASADATTLSNTPPSISSPNPANGAPSIDKTQSSVSVSITDANGDSISWTIETSLGNSDSGGGSGGVKTCSLSPPLPYSTVITWWVNATDGYDWTRTSYTFTVRDIYAPSAPTGLTATTVSRFWIDLAWTPTNDYTYIEYSASPGPWIWGAGSEVYNGTGSYYQYTAATPGETCYFQAWSYNVTDNVWSVLFASASNTTFFNNNPVINSPDPADSAPGVDKNYLQVSAYISDPDGDTMYWTIEVSNGDSDFNLGVLNGTITCTLTTPLEYGAVITWWVNVSDVWGGANDVYTFTVRNQYSPTEPEDLMAATISRTRIDLVWVPTDDYTYIEWNPTPTWAIGTGAGIVYNGTGSSYPHTGLNDGIIYYYQAWSYNVTDNIYSTLYATATNTTFANTPPGPFSNELPANESEYLSVYNEYLKINCADANSDSLTITFYWDNGTPIAFAVISAGAQASIFLPDYIIPAWLPHQNIDPYIGWYATANDGFDIVTSGTYWFTTSYAWDCNEDGQVDYLDVSSLSGAYGNSVTTGSIGPDIIEDGIVDYLDVSSLSGHYGEAYL